MRDGVKFNLPLHLQENSKCSQTWTTCKSLSLAFLEAIRIGQIASSRSREGSCTWNKRERFRDDGRKSVQTGHLGCSLTLGNMPDFLSWVAICLNQVKQNSSVFMLSLSRLHFGERDQRPLSPPDFVQQQMMPVGILRKVLLLSLQQVGMD